MNIKSDVLLIWLTISRTTYEITKYIEINIGINMKNKTIKRERVIIGADPRVRPLKPSLWAYEQKNIFLLKCYKHKGLICR